MEKLKSRKQKLCIECQKCCRDVSVYTRADLYNCSNRKVIEFYRTRGFKVHKEGDAILLTFSIPCPHLTPDGCDIYEKRPEVCREYDGMEDFDEECLWSSRPINKSQKRGKKT